MITKDIAVRLRYGDVLHHIQHVNADGTPVRCRVNGKCKTWKREPKRFRLPVKYGLKHCFYIEGDMLAPVWTCPNDLLLRVLTEMVGFVPGTWAGIVRDKLAEEGRPEAELLNKMVFGTAKITYGVSQ